MHRRIAEHSNPDDVTHGNNPSQRLRITVIGGGPIALTFCALITSRMSEDEVRIRIYDHRWHMEAGQVNWMGAKQANRRREQVVTVQSRQYTLLPSQLRDHIFKPDLSQHIWPVGPDSVNGLPPINIRISDIEDALLDWARRSPQIEFRSSRFEVGQLENLRGEHLVVICDGVGSSTRETLKIFGRPDVDAFGRDGRQLEDVVLGLRVRSGLHPSAAVIWTVAQNRFLLNPGINGEGFLNVRLTDEEALEVRGFNPARPEDISPCSQGRPCVPEMSLPRESPQRGRHRRGTAIPTSPQDGAIFNPSRAVASSRLWSRVLEGLRLFDVEPKDLKSITSFRLSMVQRPRFTSVLFHQTATQPATIATLLGDAAISVHFWPGRGLNTGIGSAASLARTVVDAWGKRSFREANFAEFEARMSQLQFRNQTRGFYGSMRVDDTTGDVVPIREWISRSYAYGRPSPAQQSSDRASLEERLRVIRESLRDRLPGGLPNLDALTSRTELLAPETVAALVASGPWDTYRPGGPELDLADLSFDTSDCRDWLGVTSRQQAMIATPHANLRVPATGRVNEGLALPLDIRTRKTCRQGQS